MVLVTVNTDWHAVKKLETIWKRIYLTKKNCNQKYFGLPKDSQNPLIFSIVILSANSSNQRDQNNSIIVTYMTIGYSGSWVSHAT